jgi:NAD(P)-dependent dehydrogenase (short-subunit alcohol dehydrogenase family)
MGSALAGKVAIVTGAASGVGEAIAIRFAREGASVVVADLNEQGLSRVVDAIASDGARAMGFTIDVSERERIDACYAATIASFGRLDVLVNNAGMASSHGSAPDTDPWEIGIANTLSSAYWMSKAAIPLLKDRGGAIVNVASLAGNTMGTPVTWYCTAKAGLVGLTRSFATTYGSMGIRTNAMALGSVDTPRLRAILDAVPELEERHNKRSPLGRPGRPSEIASVALFLASDESSYINGQLIIADGGYSLAH